MTCKAKLERQHTGSPKASTTLIAIAIFTLLALLAPLPAAADGILVFARELPLANLNQPAEPDRSNVAWADTESNIFYGDDFMLAGSSPVTITEFKLWSVLTTPGNLGDNFTLVALYGGMAGEGLTELSQGAFVPGSDANSNPYIVSTRVGYVEADGSGSTDYQSRKSGIYYPIYEHEFFNLNWVVEPGVLYQFGVYGLPISPAIWFTHASNAELSGTRQDGADGMFRAFDVNHLEAGTVTMYSGLTIWGADTDINVEIYSAVPEPGSLMLVGTGFLGLAAAVRRKLRG